MSNPLRPLLPYAYAFWVAVAILWGLWELLA